MIYTDTTESTEIRFGNQQQALAQVVDGNDPSKQGAAPLIEKIL